MRAQNIQCHGVCPPLCGTWVILISIRLSGEGGTITLPRNRRSLLFVQSYAGSVSLVGVVTYTPTGWLMILEGGLLCDLCPPSTL